jgi:hypothetical protein
MWDYETIMLCLHVHVSVCISPSINFQMREPIFTKLGMYIMVHEPISTVYFVNLSCWSMCLYVYPSITARQWLSKNIIAATNMHEIIEELLDA